MQPKSDLATGTVRSYASVPLPRSAYRALTSVSPWLGCDPQFQGECSAAVRMVRLTLFALFAIIVAPLRSRNASAENIPKTTNSPVAAELLSAADPLADQHSCVLEQAALTPVFPSEDSQQPLIHRATDEAPGPRVHLVVKHTHGPPVLHKTATRPFFSASSPRPLSQVPQHPHTSIPVLERHSCRRNPVFRHFASEPLRHGRRSVVEEGHFCLSASRHRFSGRRSPS